MKSSSNNIQGLFGPPNKKMRVSTESPPLLIPRDADAPVKSVVVLAAQGINSFNDGCYQQARTCFSQALNSASIQHINSMIMYERQHNQACHYREDDDRSSMPSSAEYDEGMQVYDHAIPLHEGVIPEIIPSILSFNIAQTYFPGGKQSEAQKWFVEALNQLKCMESVSCEAALLLVKVLNCLGYCYYKNGNDDAALMLYQRSLTLATNIDLGSFEHAAAAVNCMGILIFNKQPKSKDALVLFEQSLELYQKCDTSRGEYQVRIATVLNNIGRMRYMESKFDEALTIYDEALEIRKKWLGTNTIDVAATIYNIGQTHQQLKHYPEALRCFMEFFSIAQASFGDESRDVALAYKAIGEIYQEENDLKLAHHFLCLSLTAQMATSGGANLEVATTLNKLGNICYEMKDFKSAMKYYSDGLLIERAILPYDHQHIMITVTNIAHIHKQMGEHAKSLEAYKHVLSLQLKCYGSDDIHVAETLSSIGLIEYHLRDYERSFESFQESLRIRRHLLGTDENAEVASTLNSIGLVLFKQDMLNLAKKCFIESLRIRKSVLGDNHRDVAIVWYNIATIHFETGEDDLAIRMYEETLRVERAALGDNHPDIVLTLQHLGQVHQHLGHLEKAIEYFTMALDNEGYETGRERSVARLYNLLGNVYLQLGQTKEMMHCYIEASRLYERLPSLPSGDNSVAVTGFNLYGLSKSNPPCAPVA
jgi:tetratricopeptide (TPR) repeat protein